jgi:c-di-GMP-binding flagellar brake protein YcgR
MKLTELKIGSRLEVELLSNQGESKVFLYVSQLLEVIDPENVVIATPIANSRNVFLPLGYRVRVMLLHSVYGLVGFKGVIANKGMRDNIAVLFLQVEGGLESIQRRKYFRLDCLLSTEYRVCPEKSEAMNEADTSEPSYKKAITKNLSGSGMCIVTDEEIQYGTNLELILSISEQVKVKVAAAVMRCSCLETSRHVKYEIGLHFTELSKSAQESIIKYIFDQQRILLKKGLINKKDL